MCTQAYTFQTNVEDPKARRAGNEGRNWCSGTELKLWNRAQRRPVASMSAHLAFQERATIAAATAATAACATAALSRVQC